MKALISQKNINEYEFNSTIAVAYIKALKVLHSDGDISTDIKDVLTSAGLYKDDKLRVFNYKKPKTDSGDYLLSKEVRFLIPCFSSPENSLWYKPRFKYQREAIDVLLKRYGFRKTAYLVCVMLPASIGVEYVPQISDPAGLLSKLSSFNTQYQKQEVSKINKLLVNSLTKELEIKIQNYGIHQDT
jgi:hypothetical protein